MSSENNNDNDGEGAPSRLARMSEEEIVKAKGDAVRLARLYEEYSRPRNFKPGDFVRFHPSMRNRPNPNEHVLGIVTRVLSCPFYEDFNVSTYAPDAIDIAVGSLSQQGAFKEFYLTSKRLVKVEDTSPYDDIGNIGTICTACGTESFRGLKHRCLECENCILCDACYRAHQYPDGHVAEHTTEESEPPTPAYLRKKFEEFTEDEPLRQGDIVTWKKGFKNKNLPLAGAPCVVIDVLPNIVYDFTEDGSESSYFREPYNVRLGLLNSKETTMCIYYYDSRRFKKIGSFNH